MVQTPNSQRKPKRRVFVLYTRWNLNQVHFQCLGGKPNAGEIGWVTTLDQAAKSFYKIQVK